MLVAMLAAAYGVAQAVPAISPTELVAPKVEVSGGNVNFTVQPSVLDRNYQLQYSDTMATDSWHDLEVVKVGTGVNLVISTPYVPASAQRFYRLMLTVAPDPPAAPEGFSLIPAGSFSMGNALSASGDGITSGNSELPVHTVQMSAFYMGKYEVSKAQWDEVRTWGLTHNYTDLAVGSMSGTTNYSKGPTHPVHLITWYDTVKWCNARSEKENLTPCYYTDAAQTLIYKTGSTDINNTMVKWSANGYRLPSEAEWEKAARGGLSGKRFPWGDTITHSQANYYSRNTIAYDVSPTRGYHPTYKVNGMPYTSPVGSFAANGYGLYDMTGNISEWCWDWFSGSYYELLSGTDTHGIAEGSGRVSRGGDWGGYDADPCRVAHRDDGPPGYTSLSFGFRVVRSTGP